MAFSAVTLNPNARRFPGGHRLLRLRKALTTDERRFSGLLGSLDPWNPGFLDPSRWGRRSELLRLRSRPRPRPQQPEPATRPNTWLRPELRTPFLAPLPARSSSGLGTKDIGRLACRLAPLLPPGPLPEPTRRQPAGPAPPGWGIELRLPRISP